MDANDMKLLGKRMPTEDLISRAEAIDAVHKEFDECLVWDESGQRTADEVENILDGLPSAQPEQLGMNLAEVGTDMVSKQAVLDLWNKYHSYIATKTIEFDSELRALPSAEPQERTGKWIYHIDDLFPTESTMECSECHEHQYLTCDDNFCPNCGARMEVEHETD